MAAVVNLLRAQASSDALPLSSKDISAIGGIE
jgi:hypothetical protein